MRVASSGDHRVRRGETLSTIARRYGTTPGAVASANNMRSLQLNAQETELLIAGIRDVLTGKLAKRGVDIRALEPGKMEPVSGDKVKETIRVREGIEQERAKSIVKLIKDSKMKVQGSIQGDAVRVSGTKKDNLQEMMALVRKSVTDLPLQFKNFRD